MTTSARSAKSKAPSSSSPSAPRRSSLWKRLLVLLVPLLLLGWFAPAIVANTPSLRSWAVGRLAGPLKARVSVESLSLSWLSPPKATGVKVLDDSGNEAIVVPSLETNRTLWEHVNDPSNLGEVTLHEPQFTLHANGATTSIDGLIQEAMSGPSSDFTVTIRVVDGSGKLLDDALSRPWDFVDVDALISLPNAEAESFAASLVANISDLPVSGPPTVDLKYDWAPPTSGDATTAETRVEAKFDRFPLLLASTVAPFMGRSEDAAGDLTGHVTAVGRGASTWSDPAGAKAWTVETNAHAASLHISSPMLGDEAIHSENASLSGKANWQVGGLIEFVDTKLTTDLGEAMLAGGIDTSRATWAEMLADTSRRPITTSGRIDLAKLAAMIPATLRLHEAARVTSGAVVWNVSAGPAQASPSIGAAPLTPVSTTSPTSAAATAIEWTGRIEAADLRAIRDGRHISWDRPVLISFRVRQDERPLVVKQLECAADFVTFRVSGDSKQLAGTAEFHLDRLVEQAGQFVDLSNVKLSGDGAGSFRWRCEDGRTFRLDANADIENFLVETPGGLTWRESKLGAALTAEGVTDFRQAVRLDGAALRTQGADEWLVVKLLTPVSDFHHGGRWSLAVETSGPIESWRSRLAAFSPSLSAWRTDGRAHLKTEMTVGADSLRLGATEATLSNATIDGPSLRMLDETLTLDTSLLEWTDDWRRITCPAMSVRGQSVTIDGSNLLCRFPAEESAAPELSGKLHVDADLKRAWPWIRDAGAERTPASASDPYEALADKWRMQGKLQGDVNLQLASNRTAFRVDANVEGFQAGQGSFEPMSEKAIRIAGTGRYAYDTNTLTLDELTLGADTLESTMKGQARFADAADANLTGEFDCDWERVSDYLRPMTNQAVYISGRRKGRFSFEGPVAADFDGVLAKAKGGVNVGWQWADVYGFQVGPGTMQATLADATIQFQPSDVQVSEGTLRSLPYVRREEKTGQWIAVAKPGVVFERVRTNPRMCARALQYAAPIVAGVAKADGRYSLQLTGGRVPLDDPMEADVSGNLIIHDISVGPGPLVQEIALFVGSPEMIQIAKESTVPFRVTEGRVYHRDLKLVFPKATITTYGSVGFDQSLALMVTTPVPEQWAGNDPRLKAALRGQTINVPVNGTLAKPKLDQRAIEQLSRQFLEKAAGNLLQDASRQIEGELRRGLDKLFKQ